jgi:hypothetical protein
MQVTGGKIKTMKIVINKCFGGFGLSDKAIELYFEKKGQKVWTVAEKYHTAHYTVDPADYPTGELDEHYWTNYDIERTDTVLVDVVETLGAEADGKYASLSVVEIPDGISYEIGEYDGIEHIAETHRTWH